MPKHKIGSVLRDNYLKNIFIITNIKVGYYICRSLTGTYRYEKNYTFTADFKIVEDYSELLCCSNVALILYG